MPPSADGRWSSTGSFGKFVRRDVTISIEKLKTSLKNRIRRFAGRLAETFRYAPAETAVAVYAFLICALIRENVVVNDGYVWLLPLFFTVSFVTNRWCRRGAWRIVYYLSPLLALPLLAVDASDWTGSVAYPVTLVVCGLTVIASGWLSDNERFVERVMRYVYDLLSALLLGLAAFLALLAIFHSVVYIFNIFNGITSAFTTYAAMSAFTLLAPVCFLAFNRTSDAEQGVRPNPFFDVLLNYVLSPAVLIYTLILYLYFVTILLRWELPKGGIAYLVFGYAIVAMVLKACQPMLYRRMYDWYYGRFSLIALPALAMFWIGVGYRVQQYGFTQDRVYLVVCGAIMTATILLFFNRRSGRYLYVAVLSAFLLAVFTYVPGITAETIGIRSQMRCVGRVIARLDLADASGRMILQKRPDADTVYREDYRRLYQSFEYLSRKCSDGFMAERFGVDNAYVLQNLVIPDALQQYVSLSWPAESVSREDAERNSVMLESDGTPVDLSGYRTLRVVRDYQDGEHPYTDRQPDTLFIKSSRDSVLFRWNPDDMLKKQLSGSGYTVHDTIPVAALDSMKGALLQFETDSVKIVFDRVHLSRFPELKVEYVSVGFFLQK